MANHIVNDLLESLENAPGEKRTPERVAQLLGRCQSNDCGFWRRTCQRYDRETWIKLMITPGRRCEAGET